MRSLFSWVVLQMYLSIGTSGRPTHGKSSKNTLQEHQLTHLRKDFVKVGNGCNILSFREQSKEHCLCLASTLP